MPYDRLELSAGSGMFFRDVEVFGSSDQKQWSFCGGGVILRTAERTQLLIQITEQWTRYVKVVISNGDNPPLPFGRVTLSGLRRVITFPSTAAGPYWLYSGNAAAKEPSYDFARVMPAIANVTPVLLRKQEVNAQYQPDLLPWSDRYPHLLTVVLIAAVAAMGYITLRFLTKLRAG